MIKFKPRNNLVLVEKILKEKKVGGIILPEKQVQSTLLPFKVLRVGKAEVCSDLQIGDIILAEDMFVNFDIENKNIGLLDQKYIHVVEEVDNGSN